jgi:altronate dehydratase
LIYKAGANGAVCVLDFGNNITSTGTFTVTMPANTSTAALIRLV